MPGLLFVQHCRTVSVVRNDSVMSEVREPKGPKNYRIGIDVGLYSVGLCAIEYDSIGCPVKILASASHIHDSGVLEEKTGTTRLAAAGVSRRTRRLIRRRVKRLKALDLRFRELGWPEPEDDLDPAAPWRARARLASEVVLNERELKTLLWRALRHMARHRGWRNPYTPVAALKRPGASSELFDEFRARVESRTGIVTAGDVTVAELAVAALDNDPASPLRMGKTGKSRPVKERGEKQFSYLGGKLMQSDNANEIHTYAEVQSLSAELVDNLVELVFAAESPRGSHYERIGKDPLDQQPRAPKASDAFQRFRIISVLGNVRVNSGGVQRRLSLGERRASYDFLLNYKAGEQPTWSEVAQVLGYARGEFGGVAALDENFDERLPLRPPVHVTDHNIRQAPKGLAPIRDWWGSASSASRDALVSLLIDGHRNEGSAAGVEAWELMHSFAEDGLLELDKLALPAGRAAYSLGSLRKLTDRMLASEDDLHDARKAVFGVDDDWHPPAEPIGAPIGNPSVDRVTKIVARWIEASESEWGAPAQVTIEHVRDAFVSVKSQRERDNEMRKRFDANEMQRLAIKNNEKIVSRVRIADVRRLDAVQRQNSGCAYCGETITFGTCEMDHIVPRKGVGSTNTRENLVAVCVPCNRSKGSLPFAVWAATTDRREVFVAEAVARTRHWNRDKGISPKGWRRYLTGIRARLERTDADPEIDGRSMESVAWMANELRDRIAAKFHEAHTKVSVYQGAVTFGARQAAGIADKIPFIGGGGKTRLDRRHHVVDAAVVTLLDESVARTLAERNNLRVSSDYEPNRNFDWRSYEGSGPTAIQRFTQWRINMNRLADLLTAVFDDDRIVVKENVRLRLGDGKAHLDGISPFVIHRAVGDSLSRDEIDAASTSAMWTALSRDPDYDPVEGLPANPARRLRVHGTHYEAQDELAFFDKPRAALAVRGGWAELGDSIHHARIYRWEERDQVKYGMLRVFAADLYRHRHKDLFSVEPDQSWISMRAALPSIGRAELSDKEYLGWLVPGDEMLIDMSRLLDGTLGEFSAAFSLGARQRWKVTGFEDSGRVNLAPLYLAKEGLEKFIELNPGESQRRKSLESVFNKRWRVSVNKLFMLGRPVVVRRDSLGRPRLESKANLPVCWSAR
jgi:CRISPR-associated endonuclease Csn1